MKNLLTLSRTLAVPLAVACCPGVFAQSLGTPAADLWLGHPLRMTVPARFIEGDGGGECVNADVFYGENRLQSNRVRASVVGPQDNRQVRIEADLPIDEPVVTVSLRAGCRNSVTRSYTLLPDIASESVLTAMMRAQAPSLVTAPALPLRLATAAAAATRVRAVRPERAQAGESAPAHIRSAALKSGEEAPVRATHALFKRPAAGTSHLRIEPIDTNPQALLRVTATLADPRGDASRRATAALLWQAINADPQELLRTSAMLQKLDGDLAQLRQTAGATRAEMAALRQRIEQRQEQPWYASPLTAQVLALLVLSAAAAAGAFWWRTRGLVRAPQPWYEHGSVAPVAPAAVAAVAVASAVVGEQPVAAPQERRTEPLPVPGTKAPAAWPVVSADAATAATGVTPAAAAPAASAGMIDFELPASVARASSGVLRVETLAATFEEVEFLSSLGLSADAMDVLTAYLQDCSNPAPLAYFEFMRLCDQAEDPQALATVRRRYGRAFGVPAPTLEQVTAATGVDSLAPLSARITRAWGRPEALDLIEEALFTVPTAEAMLTVQAGRELLCLHDLAVAMIAEAGAAQAAAQTADAHPLAPWANAEDPAAAEALAQAMADADGGRHFALDVDLDAGPEPLPEKEEVPLEIELELAPLISEVQAATRREAAARAQTEAEDAFSAAVALERAPSTRH
jgi:hypothetical protein